MLQLYIKQKQILLEEYLEKILEDLTETEIYKNSNVMVEGMKYSVLDAGKRIRPILLLMILEVLGKDLKLGVPSGCAIEFIHSYSLVHDDLPALDNDSYRRGKLSTHKQFGEANAILIGDSLLTTAFEILTRYNKKILESEKIVEIVQLVSNYSGTSGMIGGQVLDLENEFQDITLDKLKLIHRNKTGKLLLLPVEIACIIAGATEKQKSNLKKFAELIGIAFQIKDDLLDIEGNFAEVGKPIGSDEKLQKATYPKLLGVDGARLELKKTIEDSKKILLEIFSKDECKVLLELTNYIGDRSK